MDGSYSDEDLTLAARLVARFGKGRDADLVEVEINLVDGGKQQLSVPPLKSEEIPTDWYL